MHASSEPFFIVGADRSGTTLLRLMLNEHKRVTIPPESWFLSPLMDAMPSEQKLDQKHLERCCEIIVTHGRWRHWGIHDAALYAAILGLRTPLLRDVVSRAYQLWATRAGKQRWGDKTPGYALEIARLRRLLPGAKFIHIVRDARDVCLSLRQRKMEGGCTYSAAAFWVRRVRGALRAGRRLPPGQYLQVSYERLVLDTERVLREVCEFLGENWDHHMLEFYQNAGKNITEAEQAAGIHAKLSRPPEPTDVARWKQELTLFQVATVEAIAGRIMRQVGQSLYFTGLWRTLLLPLSATFGLIVYTRPIRYRLGLRLPRLAAHF